MEDSGELHDLGLLIDRIHDAIFTLGDPKAGEAPVGEMRELLGIRRTGSAAETQNLEEDLSETFGIGLSEVFQCVEDRL